MDANKLESLISGYGINADDASWLRSLAPPAAVLTNPYTGQPRDYRDVESDPAGVLIVEPDAPLVAAPPAAVSEGVQQVIEEMLAVAPTCENDWEQQLRHWAAMLAAANKENRNE